MEKVELQGLINFMRKLNIFGMNVIILLKSPVGAIIAFILCWMFDLASNMFSFNLIFGEKIGDTFTGSVGLGISLTFSLLGAMVLGLGILVLSMYKSDKGSASIWLCIISFLITFSGFLLFIVPDVAFSSIEFTVLFLVQLFFCFIISAMSPFFMHVIGNRLNVESVEAFNKMINELNNKGRDIVKKGYDNVVDINDYSSSRKRRTANY